MDFIYNSMIDSIATSEKAFEFCVDNLYSFLGYNVISKSEVRPVDLKEFLFKLPSYIPDQAKPLYSGTDDFYLYLVKMYLDQRMSCKPGSRAEKYKNRAYELIKEAKTNVSLNCTYDALMIMLSLFRPWNGRLESYKKMWIIDPTITVELEDAELLKNIFDNKEHFPEKVVEKKGVIDHLFGTDYENNRARRFFFINSILLLTRMLQDRGQFEAEG